MIGDIKGKPPSKEELKKVMLWLLISSQNNHSFQWTYNNAVCEMLCLYGYLKQAVELDKKMADWSRASDAERLQITSFIISYVEEL